jgi:acetyl-CoA carboxylase biotin carboxyl carrier protein
MTEIRAEDIEALVQTFESSDWDELRVVVDGLELYLSKDPNDRRAPTPVAAASTPASATAPSAAVAPPALKPPGAEIPEGLIVVRAPNLGTFYRAPKPGAPPYVVVGQRIEPSTEICLIEVMKLFTSVIAGAAGTVQKILVEDAQLVEFDQPLFLIDPQG